jgi:isoleucyl-tRNA synthetase
MFKNLGKVTEIPQEEEQIIKYWNAKDIFKKSLKIREGNKRYIFFEGPPTANGRPGVHHGLSRVYKDTVLRYKSLTGFYVPRRGGWDTQGLPVEIEVEKMLGIHTKREIEEYGVEKFNKLCKESVMKYEEEWERMTERIGFWLDMEHAYFTYNNKYLETVWWILKQIFDKGLLYEGRKVVPYCPRCGTTLSSHEVSLGYKKVKDPSIYVRFKVKDERFPDTHLLVWTTTPWTLPSNVAVAISPEFTYLLVEYNGEKLILADTRAEAVLGKDYKVIKKLKASELEGVKYEPLYEFAGLSEEEKERGFKVVIGDFVTATEGSGIVHMAPAFGEDDLRMGLKYNLPFVQLVDLEGKLTAGPWKGMFVKKADPLIINDLKERGLLFKKELYEHDYPFCWRCGTPLLYYAKKSWFIKIKDVKDNLIANNETVNWYPEHIKHGRFGKWLENINDWALSRERFWGTPLNIWVCKECGHKESIGSIEELREKAIEDVPENIELHKPYVDNIHIKCPKCGGVMERVPEVIDVWFDSGSMPYAQWHYPFENKEEFEQNFPADFITEGIDQTRGWFYSLLAISTLVRNQAPYKNVMCLELVLDEKGQKMSKSKGNVIDPWSILNKQGADAFRWSIYTASPPWTPRRFGPNVVNDALKGFIIPLRNVYSFFALYSNIDKFNPFETEYIPVEERSVLDKWIISKLESLNKKVIKRMEQFDITPLTRDMQAFVDELSNWYVRRSRRRFWKSENDNDKFSAYFTLYEVLRKFAVMLAPFTPFLSEVLYQNLVSGVDKNAKESVHLEDYPDPNEKLIDEKLIDNMELLINITSLGRSARKKSKIKVRQPLSKIVVYLKNPEEREVIAKNKEVIEEELNIKNVEIADNIFDYCVVSLKPNLPVLGKSYGKKLPLIARELNNPDKGLEFVETGKVMVNLGNETVELTKSEVLLDIEGKDNYIGVFDKGYFVFLDTALTDELIKEGTAREIVHAVQNLRKEAGLDIADRIELSVEPVDDAVKSFKDYIKKETLAVSIGSVENPVIAKELKVNETNYRILLKKA